LFRAAFSPVHQAEAELREPTAIDRYSPVGTTLFVVVFAAFN